VIYVDTHVLAWLFAGDLDRFSTAALDVVEHERLFISPMVGLELQFLFERRRASKPASEVLSALSAEAGLTVCDLPFTVVAARARDENWTRDPFDRLIVAQAQVRGAPLLTCDVRIRRHYPRAIWDSSSAR
jgi:PIN domain nuclease of toxin-antitoxin system